MESYQTPESRFSPTSLLPSSLDWLLLPVISQSTDSVQFKNIKRWDIIIRLLPTESCGPDG